MSEVKERPILFSGEMVRAILDGRKTQTRRIVKKKKDWAFGCELAPSELAGEINAGKFSNSIYGEPGERLWVRETFTYDVVERPPYDQAGNPTEEQVVIYKASDRDPGCYDGKWKPSIFMPRDACRLTLEILNVKIERLRDISAEDCLKEGILPHGAMSVYQSNNEARQARFKNLWESINGADSWEKNPWVWVIEFKRVKP